MNLFTPMFRGNEAGLDEPNQRFDMADSPDELDMCGKTPTAVQKDSDLLIAQNIEMKNDMRNEVDRLERVCTGLQRKLETLDAEAEVLRRAQLSHQEKIRRQKELLDEATDSANIAVAENRELVAKVARLEKWTDTMDDTEAAQTTRLLYQELDDWVKRQFMRPLTNGMSADSDVDERGENAVCPTGEPSSHLLYDIESEIFKSLFVLILAPFMAGSRKSTWEYSQRAIDREVQKLCPVHVWQHWRSATSIAAASLDHTKLEETCDEIVQHFEAKFGHFAVTDETKRRSQLKHILWKCVTFKHKLERQGNTYCFWWSSSGMALREERMMSITGEYPPDGTVGQTLWPMLYRQTPNKWIIVAKEVVVISSPASYEEKAQEGLQPQISGTPAEML
ncbi:hypothetical protein N7532_010950 [Penicillium argentinense]|uniref:Uncharacterized protein n=1 Tax=Penicillium argentinense TaxID=1131581 RepID=A0A9W9EQR4_9EURO|nr:uncharacterized protein N7532_010950 [Penicillium argentinense]KAJ5086179.1 hypothetical protein N7532_010950 [Penicillium argentinense]